MNVFSRGQRKLFVTGILFLFIPKLINSYFLMPFPGSMDAETMQVSFMLDKVADFFLFTGGAIVCWGCIALIMRGSMGRKAGGVILLLAAAAFYYFTLFEFSAEKMFREPEQVTFKKASLTDYDPDAYILGVTDGGVSKAYPVKYLAYHHKIHDQINDKSILVTYCSMCRSGRVFIPVVEGEKVTFRLVGARHYNAVVEDSKTGTWWYQATGEAAAGKLKGKKLEEFQCEQTTWKTWLRKHPNTLLLQPDPGSVSKYAEWFATFDSMRSPADTSGSRKIWVAGVTLQNQAVAYQFPSLVRAKAVNDKIGSTPVLVTIENDSLSTHVWKRTVDNQVLEFKMDSSWTTMKDILTASVWNADGLCIEGVFNGKQLEPVQHYNEFLRSWEQFHPGTTVWK